MGRDHQEPLNLNPSLEEQVFSNPLLFNLIWKHLKTQDLLLTSAVSRAWFTKSRKVLTEGKNKHAICAQIDSHSPCRALLKLNAFLGETHAAVENPLTYNGIKYLFAPDSVRTMMGSPRCFKCLKKDFIAGDIGETADPTWSAAQEQLIMDQLPKIYGNILANIQFKHMYIHDDLSWYCPFTCLIKWCFQRERQHILEIHYGVGYQYSFDHDFFFARDYSNTNTRMEFPNLEVLGLKSLSRNRENQFDLGIEAPSLKRITRFAFDPASRKHRNLGEGFPRHAITNLKTFTRSVKSVIPFLQQYQPKIEVLNFEDNCNPKTVVIEDVFRLGSLISATLTNLTCSLSTLKLLVCGSLVVNGNQTQNQLLALESLDVHDTINVEALDWFNSFDFREDFPKLQQLSLGYKIDEIVYDSTVSGPVWVPKLKDDPRFDRITHLSLKHRSWYGNSISASDWLYQFRNVSHLTLGISIGAESFEALTSQIKILQVFKETEHRSE